MNRYQRRKARALAAVLMLAAVSADVCYSEAATLAARMTQDQWRTVSMVAGVPVADKGAQTLAVAYLITLGEPK